MKSKSKVVIVIMMLFLVSTIACATSVNAVKAGEVIKVHMSAEGSDLWDPQAMVSINASVEHNYVSSWAEKADFKKTNVDPTPTEEVMLCHGRLKDGEAFYLEWWFDEVEGQWWQYVWIIVGTGVVKTRTDTYSEATITLIFCLGGNWAWAGFEDPESGDSGPNNPVGRWGTLTTPITTKEIGADQFDFIKQEQDIILDVWINGGNRISNDTDVNVAETNYIIVGMLQTDQERKDKLFNLPWAWTMLLDAGELELSSFWWYDKEGVLIGESAKVLVFYHIFEPWSLGLGSHTLDHELSWYNGVGVNAYQEVIYFQWEFMVSDWSIL